MTNNTVQQVGDISTGTTAGFGFVHLVTENATFISISVMVVSAVVAIVFHVLGYVLKRRELEVLQGDHRDGVVRELMEQMGCEQDRAALKKAARSLRDGL